MLKAKFFLTDGPFSHGPRALRPAPGDPSRQPCTEGHFCSPGPVCVRARPCVLVWWLSLMIAQRGPCRYSVMWIGEPRSCSIHDPVNVRHVSGMPPLSVWTQKEKGGHAQTCADFFVFHNLQDSRPRLTQEVNVPVRLVTQFIITTLSPTSAP